MTYSLRDNSSIDVIEHTGYCEKQDIGVLNMIWNTTNISFWLVDEPVHPAREPRNWPWKSLSKDDTLLVWHLAFFRQVDYVFDKTIEVDGLKLWRFKRLFLCVCVFSEDTLKNATNNPYNVRYYSFGYDGVLNLTARKHVPKQTVAFLSYPHFCEGDYYVDHVGQPTGMDVPDSDVDLTYLELEPQTGIVLKNWLAFQTNFQVFPLSRNVSYVNASDQVQSLVTNFSNLPNFLVPMGYEAVDAFAPSHVTKSLATSLNLIAQLKHASLFGGLTVAVASIAMAVWLMCRRYQKTVVEKCFVSIFFEKFQFS
ncbi:hypothetical protein RFI_12025 [Reticulomyxa filosa]|uniref:Uncharacterized protein n=1 Tax=Reticulomyxa filosa TaxID=46433 RepID=X6NID9_RETFI|nr:hypothetical protein RFI_12025 [Reticulomyxa filosa]|eukprot:ETO25117.1 hypothetical protein RFI_12025 [Reticulomyxa filosa]